MRRRRQEIIVFLWGYIAGCRYVSNPCWDSICCRRPGVCSLCPPAVFVGTAVRVIRSSFTAFTGFRVVVLRLTIIRRILVLVLVAIAVAMTLLSRRLPGDSPPLSLSGRFGALVPAEGKASARADTASIQYHLASVSWRGKKFRTPGPLLRRVVAGSRLVSRPVGRPATVSRQRPAASSQRAAGRRGVLRRDTSAGTGRDMTYGSNRVAGGTIEGGGGCCWFAWVWTSALMFMDGGRRKSESCELGGWLG